MTRNSVIFDTKTRLPFHSCQSASDAQPFRRVGRRIWQWFTVPLRWSATLPSALLIVWAATVAYMVATHASASANEFKFYLAMTGAFGVLVTLLTMILTIIAINISVKRIRRAEYCPCMQCGYTLTGLSKYSRCPECGTAHDVVRLHQFWQRHRWARRGLRDCKGWTERHTYICSNWREVRESIFWVIGVYFAFYFIGIGLDKLNKLLNGPFHGLEFIPYLGLLVIACLFWKNIHRRKRFVRCRFALCRKCGFDLHQHPPRGTCPKCGTEYEKRELREYWKERWPVNWERDVLVPAMRAERLLSVLEQKEQEQQYKVACNKA